MAKIEIKWLDDEHDCDTCGTSWAEGAIVTIDGERALDLDPLAHCFGSDDYSREEVLRRILAHLGHEVVEADE